MATRTRPLDDRHGRFDDVSLASRDARSYPQDVCAAWILRAGD
jgi:hypothetical protein